MFVLITSADKDKVMCVFDSVFVTVWAVQCVGMFDTMEMFVQPYA